MTLRMPASQTIPLSQRVMTIRMKIVALPKRLNYRYLDGGIQIDFTCVNRIIISRLAFLRSIFQLIPHTPPPSSVSNSLTFHYQFE